MNSLIFSRIQYNLYIDGTYRYTFSIITSLHKKYSIPCILISKPIDKYLSIFTTPSISDIYNFILESTSSFPSDPIIFVLLKDSIIPCPPICILYSLLLSPMEFYPHLFNMLSSIPFLKNVFQPYSLM